MANFQFLSESTRRDVIVAVGSNQRENGTGKRNEPFHSQAQKVHSPNLSTENE